MKFMLVIGAKLKSTKIQRLLRLKVKESGEGCTITKWRLSGKKKLGLIMRMTSEPYYWNLFHHKEGFLGLGRN